MLLKNLRVIKFYVKCTCNNKRHVQNYLEYIMHGSMVDIKFDTTLLKIN